VKDQRRHGRKKESMARADGGRRSGKIRGRESTEGGDGHEKNRERGKDLREGEMVRDICVFELQKMYLNL
jgi:hypothetical protein